MENTYIDSWKNKALFEKQLALNLQELAGPYPFHWDAFLKGMNIINPQEGFILKDIGCGCGAFSELLKKHYPGMTYEGYDYSEEAISLATKTWKQGLFFKKDYNDFKKEDFKDTDIMHASGFHTILPNGDECMEFLLSLQPKWALFEKLCLTHQYESYYETYKAYEEITTYQFYHNKEILFNIFKKYGYESTEIDPKITQTNVLLKRINV